MTMSSCSTQERHIGETPSSINLSLVCIVSAARLDDCLPGNLIWRLVPLAVRLDEQLQERRVTPGDPLDDDGNGVKAGQACGSRAPVSGDDVVVQSHKQRFLDAVALDAMG